MLKRAQVLRLPEPVPVPEPPQADKRIQIPLNPGAIVCLCRHPRGGDPEVIRSFHVEGMLLRNDALQWAISDDEGRLFEGGHYPVRIHSKLEISPLLPLEYRSTQYGMRTMYTMVIPADCRVYHLSWLRKRYPRSLHGLRLAG